MPKFFESIDSINQFTRSLDYQARDLQCIHCSQQGQLVSHGFVYKQRSQTLCEPVGKRVFCSNRHGRTGCGRTFQLYLSSELPAFHYGAIHLFTFVSSLLAHFSVTSAYQKATKNRCSRQAWRWLNRLTRQLMEYRSTLSLPHSNASPYVTRKTRRFQILLPSLKSLFIIFQDCSDYQFKRQIPFC